MKKEELIEQVLQAIYPRRCPVCHDIVQPKGELVCRSCADKIQPVREPRCKKCSKPLEKEEQEYCTDCNEHGHVFEEAAGIFLYGRILSASLMKCKYGGRREYLDHYGQMMVRYGGTYISRWRPQALVPIPLHKSQMRRRGFNQSACLAHAIGRAFGIPVQEHMLEKVKKTRQQKELDMGARRQNIKGAFSVGKDPETCQRILLVDDVYTTGSTVDEAARCLKGAGCGEVYVLTLCIGKGF